MYENKVFGSLCLCNSSNRQVEKACRDKRKGEEGLRGVEDKPRESSSENREQAAYPYVIIER